MAAPKPLKRAGMAIPTTADGVGFQYDPPFVPLDDFTVAQAIIQLQNTLNDLIANYNLHQHSALNAAPSTNLEAGAGSAAQNKFTAT